MIYIQMASASTADRDDDSLDSFSSDGWETVASGKDWQEATFELVRSYNDELIDGSNAWLRIIDNDGKVITA